MAMMPGDVDVNFDGPFLLIISESFEICSRIGHVIKNTEKWELAIFCVRVYIFSRSLSLSFFNR